MLLLSLFIRKNVLIIILVLGGLYFTFRTKFVQFRLFGEQIRSIVEKPSDGKGVSSFQALMVSTASRVGTGNIIGVTSAILTGGPGAVVWMWVSAFFGTHTHVQTADEQILPSGTAYITDAGMTGVEDSVLGLDAELMIKKFVTKIPQYHNVAKGDIVMEFGLRRAQAPDAGIYGARAAIIGGCSSTSNVS